MEIDNLNGSIVVQTILSNEYIRFELSNKIAYTFKIFGTLDFMDSLDSMENLQNCQIISIERVLGKHKGISSMLYKFKTSKGLSTLVTQVPDQLVLVGISKA